MTRAKKLSPEARHEQDRLAITTKLSEAGWEPDDIRMDAADCEYDNGTVTLRVVQTTNEPRFNFSLTTRDDDEVLVNFEYGDKLGQVLAKIIELQDRFARGNIDDLLNEIDKVADEIYVYIDDEPVPIREAAARRDAEGGDRDEPRVVIARTLSAARWRKIDERSFEHKGKLALKVVAATKKSEDDDQALYLLLGKERPVSVTLIVYFHEALAELLGAIVSFQDSIDENNYDGHLRHLLRICPETFLFRDGKATLLVDEQVGTMLGDKT
jgi:hypothetical protein